MCFTRLVILVLCGSSWEMSSVKDSLTMECMVRLHTSTVSRLIVKGSPSQSQQNTNNLLCQLPVHV